MEPAKVIKNEPKKSTIIETMPKTISQTESRAKLKNPPVVGQKLFLAQVKIAQQMLVT